MILGYLRKNNLKKLGMIKSEISFFNILIEELKRNLAEDESLTEFDAFLPTDSDFRSAIARLKGKQFDILGVYLIPPQVSQFYRQASEQNFHPRTFGSTTFENKSVIRDSLGFMDGAVYSHIGTDEQFYERYKARFKDDAQISYAANAYDFANLIGRLFGRSTTKISGETIISTLSSVGDEKGAAGRYQFKSSEAAGKYFSFPVVVKKVEGNKIIVVN